MTLISGFYWPKDHKELKASWCPKNLEPWGALGKIQPQPASLIRQAELGALTCVLGCRRDCFLQGQSKGPGGGNQPLLPCHSPEI